MEPSTLKEHLPLWLLRVTRTALCALVVCLNQFTRRRRVLAIFVVTIIAKMATPISAHEQPCFPDRPETLVCEGEHIDHGQVTDLVFLDKANRRRLQLRQQLFDRLQYRRCCRWWRFCWRRAAEQSSRRQIRLWQRHSTTSHRQTDNRCTAPASRCRVQDRRRHCYTTDIRWSNTEHKHAGDQYHVQGR